ncbi:MAG: glycosyltransferase family 4 protein [Blastocatellia bacterium]|nr:glycosyltransferase family 4 protein [Blastocatellia bacterium]
MSTQHREHTEGAEGTAQIGYILKGYPRTSETFISNEIYFLESEGMKLSIFSLKKLQGQKLHGVVNKIKAPVTYLPEISPSEEGSLGDWLWKNGSNFAASHWKLFLARPISYLRTLYEAVSLSLQHRSGGSIFSAPNRTFFKEFFQAGYIALKVLESGRIRHLHAHFCHTAATVAMLAGRLAGVPFSFTAHAKDIYRSDMNPGDLLQVKLRRAQFVVTCTKANWNYLKRFSPEEKRLYNIYHGLDVSLFAPSQKIATGLEQVRPPLILSVGRFVEKKGFIYLVDACRLLKDKGLKFKCLIVGEGEEKERIARFIERFKMGHFVDIKQPVTQEELRQIYRQATLFALPCQVVENGDRDGIPNVLVEAMAMELPVVSTGISGIPELIENRMNGLLVPEKDVPALAQAIEDLLENPGLRRNLGLAARSTVCWYFDARENIMTLKNLFQSSLSASDME